jgi:thiamine biosynthesis lipoprotein
MPDGVDPTGYVKGWTAQHSLDVLSGPGIYAAVVSAAGDIATTGNQIDDKPLRMEIVNPQRPRELVTIVESDGAITTSRTYERGNHLVDPHTRQSCSLSTSTTVVGPGL